MKDNNKKISAPNQPAKAGPQIEEPVAGMLTWLKTYGLSAAVGIGIVIVVIISAAAYRSQQSKSNDMALRQLMAAKGTLAVEQVLTQYPSAPCAPEAQLRLANDRFHDGLYNESMADYDKFLAKYKNHPNRITAEMGRLMCMEAAGRSAEALAGLTAFTNQYAAQLYMIPQAIFAKARCLQEMGQLVEAKAVYENFFVANTNNGWAAQAESSIALIDRQLRKGESAQNIGPLILQTQPTSHQAPTEVAPVAGVPTSEAAPDPSVSTTPATPVQPVADTTPAP